MEPLHKLLSEMHQSRSAPIILAHSVLAASAAAVPVPWIDLPVVTAIQSHLSIAWPKPTTSRSTRPRIAQVSVAIGGRIALRMGLRELLKFIPWVGIAANAAAAFAFMYASGWVWYWYFLQIQQGHVPSADELRDVYREQLQKGVELWQVTHRETHA